MLRGIGLALLALALTIVNCAARAGGDWADSPLHHWFVGQHSVSGKWCCNVADGHILDNKDWRVRNNRPRRCLVYNQHN